MNKKQERIWKRANRKFGRAFAKAELLSKKQTAMISVMEKALAELHMINNELHSEKEKQQ